MIQITEDNRPKCEKCKENALTQFNNHWVCGSCFAKIHQKIKESNERFFLEE